MKNVTTTFNSNHLYLSIDGSNRNWNGPGDSSFAVIGMKGRKIYNIYSTPIGIATAADGEISAMAIALQAAVGGQRMVQQFILIAQKPKRSLKRYLILSIVFISQGTR